VIAIGSGSSAIPLQERVFLTVDKSAAEKEESHSCSETMKTLWLYRILEVDDDGDPLDHGAARALDEEELCEMLSKRMANIVGEGVQLTARIYEMTDRRSGILDSSLYQDVKFGTR
jgi:hypothetical protein